MSKTDMNLNCPSVQARLAASWGYVKPSSVRAGYFAYDVEHNIWEEVSSTDAPGATALYMVGDTPETTGAAAIKLPVDVTIGCGTIKAGCSLQTLLTRIEIINQTWQPKALADHFAASGKLIAEPVTISCDCGDMYERNSFGGKFIQQYGCCPNCDAAEPVKQEPVQFTIPLENSDEARVAIEEVLADYQYPSNPMNAARAGWRAARLAAAPVSAPEQDPVIGDVFFICDAYESGFGHGAKNDGLNDGSIFSDSRHGEAYELGYAEGLKRSNREQDKQEPVAFYIYKPTPARFDQFKGGVLDGSLPWVYDQDPASGFCASMLVTPCQAIESSGPK